MKPIALLVALALGAAPAVHASDRGTNYKDPKDMLGRMVTSTDSPNPWFTDMMNKEILPAVAKAAPTVKNPKVGTSITIDQIYAGTTLQPSIDFPNLPASGFNAGDAVLATSGTVINCNAKKSTASITVSQAQEAMSRFSTESSIGSTVGVGVSTKVSPFGIGATADVNMDITMDQSWTKTVSTTNTVSWDLGNDIEVDGKKRITFAAKVYNLDLNQIPANVKWQFTSGVVDITITWFASDPSNKKEPEKIIAKGTITRKNVDLVKTFSDKLRTVNMGGTYTHTGAAAAIIVTSAATPVSASDCGSGSGDKPKVDYDTPADTKAKATQLKAMKVDKTYKLKARTKPR